ncbi:DUF523 domain-containing protein [Amycolatopsis sp. NPDC059027]|uniref:DUF523 domain-containing protein n=1 Tax=unclassified Amycolatopsis TaxID=2618356 RepID=UPI00367055A6
MRKVLVSACLAGVPCRYDGAAKTSPAVVALVDSGEAVPFCAEVASGLSTPRRPAEIVDGDGDAVLDGRARVVDDHGTDVTEQFIAGAQLAFVTAREHEVREAVLMARSPSCGCGEIYDGTFAGERRQGNGVTAALLLRNGIAVRSSDELPDAPA